MTVLIILNEKEFAEKCLSEHQVIGKPFFVLTVLAKYYYHHLGYRKKEIITLLIEFMEQNYPYYSNNKLDWDSNIERIVKNVNQYTLYEIDGVWITRSEMDTIGNIHNKLLERLAFTFLCLAKLGNLKNTKNNGWVNIDDKEIYTLAHITCNLKDRDVKIGKLCKLGLLELSQRNDNLSCRVTFVNDTSEKVLQVCDFRELGYEYLRYRGENYIRCKYCGILTKGSKNKKKEMCVSCAKYSPKGTMVYYCVECGQPFQREASSRRIRCDGCRDKERQRINRENIQKWRQKKMV